MIQTRLVPARFAQTEPRASRSAPAAASLPLRSIEIQSSCSVVAARLPTGGLDAVL